MELEKKKRRREAELEDEMLKLDIAEKKANSSGAGSSICPSIKSFTFEETKEASVKSLVKEAQKQIVKPTVLDENLQEAPNGKSSSITYHPGSILNSTMVEPFTPKDFQQSGVITFKAQQPLVQGTEFKQKFALQSQFQPSRMGTEKVTFDRQQPKSNPVLGNNQPAVVKPKVAISDPSKGSSTSSQQIKPDQDIRYVYVKAPSQPVQTMESFRSNLPKLKLPEVSEDPLEWPEWAGLFQVTVHAAHITDSTKKQHLKTLVTGKAKEAIADLGFSGEMYHAA